MKAKTASTNFTDEVIECVNTTWVDKEDRLKRIFLRHYREFSREAVENIVYGDYLSRGGYRDRERIVGWIFSDNDMYAHNKRLDAEVKADNVDSDDKSGDDGELSILIVTSDSYFEYKEPETCNYCISAESGHNVHCRNFREALND